MPSDAWKLSLMLGLLKEGANWSGPFKRVYIIPSQKVLPLLMLVVPTIVFIACKLHVLSGMMLYIVIHFNGDVDQLNAVVDL